MSDECIVYGCKNKKSEGNFIGDICCPCYEMITKGKTYNPSTNIISSLYNENLKLKKEIKKPIKPKRNGLQIIEEGNGTFCKKCGSTMERKYRWFGGLLHFGKIIRCHNKNCE